MAVPRTRDALEARIVHRDQVRLRRAPQVIFVRRSAQRITRAARAPMHLPRPRAAQAAQPADLYRLRPLAFAMRASEDITAGQLVFRR